MKANTTYLKHGSKTAISMTDANVDTWTLTGEGQIIPVGSGVHYVAPMIEKSGSAVISCENSLGEVSKITIFYGTHLYIVANIIQKELGLGNDQVHISWEKFKIPSDKRIYVTIRGGGGQVVGNVTHGEDDVIQSVSIIDPVSIDLFSIDQSAIVHTARVIMAMRSRYAQSQMEVNSMRISSMPTTFNNVSAAEGAVGLKRFNATFNIYYNRITFKTEDYFDEFQTEFIEEP